MPHCCLLEQHLLGVLAHKRGIKPATLLQDGQSVVGRSYTHFVGNIKTDKFALNKLKAWLTPDVLRAAQKLDRARDVLRHLPTV